MITDYDSKIADLQTVWKQTELHKDERAVYQVFSDEFPVDADSFKPADMLNMPEIERWIGKKRFKSLRAIAQSVPVEDYSKDLAIPLTRVWGDRSGIVGRTLANFANSVASDKNKLATEALLDGFTKDGYDGVPFFSTAHPNGPNGTTQSNLSTSPLGHAAFRGGVTIVEEYQDESGKPLERIPRILMVGPSQEELALEIVKAASRAYAVDATGAEASSSVIGATNIPNVRAGRYEVVVNRRLVGDYANYWFLIDDSPGTRPVQIGTLVEPTPRDNLSDNYREVAEARFSVDHHAGYGRFLWQTCYGSTGAS